jgi:LuxR family maltose regulon positive regulatory protein
MRAWYLASLGVTSLIPAWLLSTANLDEPDTNMPEREYLTRARCMLASQRYVETLAILQIPRPAECKGSLILAELTQALFEAVAHYHLGETHKALAAFERAYDHSQNGELIMPFIEFGRQTSALVGLALKAEQSSLPKKWLAEVERRACAFAKKAAVVAARVKREHQIELAVELSPRERQLLNDICQGLSREEISATRFLSINTVKTEVKTLYTKLGVSSGLEAMRVALESDLVKLTNRPFGD